MWVVGKHPLPLLWASRVRRPIRQRQQATRHSIVAKLAGTGRWMGILRLRVWVIPGYISVYLIIRRPPPSLSADALGSDMRRPLLLSWPAGPLCSARRRASSSRRHHSVAGNMFSSCCLPTDRTFPPALISPSAGTKDCSSRCVPTQIASLGRTHENGTGIRTG